MRVAVQASDLDHSRIDGTRVYLKELLHRFSVLSPETDFLLYHQNQFNPDLAPPERANYLFSALHFPFAWMQTRFALELFLKRPEKLFLPIQAAPIFIPKGTEVTTTIHDLAFKKYPKTFPLKDRLKLNFLLDVAVKRADKLIAVSQSTKQDLLTFFPKLSPEKIRVIHHGFDSDFFEESVDTSLLAEGLVRYGLSPENYILYVGALQPRKNLTRLIKAFSLAKKEYPEMKLLLVGERAWLSAGIFEAAKKSEYKKDIIFTGRVSFKELRRLYQGARFFAFPSLYEGFGLPLLEAFASRVPVLTSSNSSLPEVAGKGALFCDASSTEDIAKKLSLLWQDADLRKSLISKGQQELTRFSWEKCAKETLSYILE
ncbi:MAG: glycosyltransferase family 1 protein [Patescibacteria group bacterium]